MEEQRRLVQRLRAATPEEIVRMLEETVGVSDSTRRGLLQDLLLEQYARLDGEGGAAFFKDHEEGRYYGHFMTTWARVSPEAALEWTLAQDGGWRIPPEMQEMLNEVAENPALFTRMALTLAEKDSDVPFLSKGLKQLAHVDPAGALELVEQISGYVPRPSILAATAAGWGKRDPLAAYAWAEKLEDTAERQVALRGVLLSWAETEPREVARRITESKGADSFDGNHDPFSGGDYSMENIVRNVARFWALTDPKAAAVWASKQPQTGNMEDVLRKSILPAREDWPAMELVEILRAIAPDRAKRAMPASPFSQSQSDSSQPGEYSGIGGLGFSTLHFGEWLPESGIGGWQENLPAWDVKDPARTVAELEKMPADPVRQELLRVAAKEWARQDRDEVLSKMAGVSDQWMKAALLNAFLGNPESLQKPEDLRKTLAALGPELAGVAKRIEETFWMNLAVNDPARGEQALSEEPTPVARESLTKGIAMQRMASDPVGAMTWLLQQPEPVREKAVQNVMNQWATRDTWEASAWLASMPPSPVRDQAALGLVTALRESDPEDAVTWADNIADEMTREQAFGRIIMSSAVHALARANRLLESMRSITPQGREQLRGLIQDYQK